MHTEIVYRIRHRLTGQWKAQGKGGYFTDNFYWSGHWDKLTPVKGMFNFWKRLLKENPTNDYYKECYDIENWEVVSYNVTSVEKEVIIF